MLKRLRELPRATRLIYNKRVLFTIALITLLAVGAAAQGGRRIIAYESILYGGRQFSTFVSCGSTAGNHAYTCAEEGQCYENTNIDANSVCAENP